MNIRWILIVVCSVIVQHDGLAWSDEEEEGRPNILFIMSDDHTSQAI